MIKVKNHCLCHCDCNLMSLNAPDVHRFAPNKILENLAFFASFSRLSAALLLCCHSSSSFQVHLTLGAMTQMLCNFCWRACWLPRLHAARFERSGAQQGGCRSSASRTNAEPQQLHHNNATMHFATPSRRSSFIVLCAGRHGSPNARTTVVIRPLPVRLCVRPLSPSATLQAHKDDHSCKCMA